MRLNLASLIDQGAKRHPAQVFVRLGEIELTYAQVHHVAQRVAAYLKSMGVQPGDRVGIMLPNVPQFPIAYYGVLMAGGVVVPMNVLLKGREVTYYLEDSGAKALIAWSGFGADAKIGADEAGVPLLITEQTHAALRRGAPMRALPAQPVRGYADPVPLFTPESCGPAGGLAPPILGETEAAS